MSARQRPPPPFPVDRKLLPSSSLADLPPRSPAAPAPNILHEFTASLKSPARAAWSPFIAFPYILHRFNDVRATVQFCRRVFWEAPLRGHRRLAALHTCTLSRWASCRGVAAPGVAWRRRGPLLEDLPGRRHCCAGCAGCATWARAFAVEAPARLLQGSSISPRQISASANYSAFFARARSCSNEGVVCESVYAFYVCLNVCVCVCSGECAGECESVCVYVSGKERETPFSSGTFPSGHYTRLIRVWPLVCVRYRVSVRVTLRLCVCV